MMHYKLEKKDSANTIANRMLPQIYVTYHKNKLIVKKLTIIYIINY